MKSGAGAIVVTQVEDIADDNPVSPCVPVPMPCLAGAVRDRGTAEVIDVE